MTTLEALTQLGINAGMTVQEARFYAIECFEMELSAQTDDFHDIDTLFTTE